MAGEGWNKYDRELHETDWMLQKINSNERPLRWAWIVLGALWVLAWLFGWRWEQLSLDWSVIYYCWIYPFAVWCVMIWNRRRLRKKSWEVKKLWREEQEKIETEIARIDELNRKAQAEEVRKAGERYFDILKKGRLNAEIKKPLSRNEELRDSLE